LAGGDLIVTLKGGKGNLSTELHFTDNSSWIRGRKFRLALQLLPGCSFDGLHIREAITEPFAVKDKRGKRKNSFTWIFFCIYSSLNLQTRRKI